MLRLCPPVPGTIRTAGKDDVIPLSQPITLKSGKTISNIEVKQGDSFFIPMVAFNQNAQVWGPDVMSFRPERWLDGSNSGASSSAGFLAYSPLLTFLGGPRACIGYRFSVCKPTCPSCKPLGCSSANPIVSSNANSRDKGHIE